MNPTRKMISSAIAAAAMSFLPQAPAMAAQPPGTDWLWLSANLTDCTFTVVVNWAGYSNAKYLEVFATEGYAGTPVASTITRIKSKDNTATVTMTPLAPSATAAYWYPWAQLLDSHGVAIPSSLDFSGQTLAYCAAP